MTVTYRVLHPVDGLLVVIKVNIIAILKPSNGDHCIITLVIWVQGNAIDDAVSHHHQERILNYNKKFTKQNTKTLKICLQTALPTEKQQTKATSGYTNSRARNFLKAVKYLVHYNLYNRFQNKARKPGFLDMDLAHSNPVASRV